MKVLIIDDSEYKIKSIKAVVEAFLNANEIDVAKSFQTGLVKLLNKPDLLLLDMTLPTSEGDDGQLEGRMRIFGGKEIMAEMEFLEINSKVVIITQFDRFGDPQNEINSADLFDLLKAEFPTLYYGGIYFSHVDFAWRQELGALLKKYKKGRIK